MIAQKKSFGLVHILVNDLRFLVNIFCFPIIVSILNLTKYNIIQQLFKIFDNLSHPRRNKTSNKIIKVIIFLYVYNTITG